MRLPKTIKGDMSRPFSFTGTNEQGAQASIHSEPFDRARREWRAGEHYEQRRNAQARRAERAGEYPQDTGL